MPIIVRFFGSLRELAGKREFEINTPEKGRSIHYLIMRLSKEFGENFKKSLFDLETGKILPYIKLMVNGRNIELLEGLKTVVGEGDIVQIFPPIGGG